MSSLHRKGERRGEQSLEEESDDFRDRMGACRLPVHAWWCGGVPRDGGQLHNSTLLDHAGRIHLICRERAVNVNDFATRWNNLIQPTRYPCKCKQYSKRGGGTRSISDDKR